MECGRISANARHRKACIESRVLEDSGSLSVIPPRSSSCRQPLNECRQKLPLYILARSAGLCAGMRCIKPLAPSRNETNSSRVSGGADGAILAICSYGGRDQETSRIHLAALRTRFAAKWTPAPPEQERTGGVPGVSARHRPRQKSGRARDQSQSAVSRHRSDFLGIANVL